MKILILISVILHLVIGVPTPNENLKYGDIIAFPKERICGCRFSYNHYAIYLDKKRFPEQKEDQNLFHFTGPILQMGLNGCIFGKFDKKEKYKKDNYLDNIDHFIDNVSEDAITKRIKEEFEKCKKNKEKWWPLSNNCEHLATYIRYGVKVSLQFGKDAARKVKNPHISEELLKRIKEEMEILNMDHCDICPTDTKAG
ncbi:uncharacterized protein FYW61_006416 isoform 2-T2 [Anableps anableps]